MKRFTDIFAGVEDPRAANARHDFLTVLFIALLGVLCGAQSCADMADFGQSKKKLLRTCLRLPHGAPGHDTFSRVFRHLDPQAFAGAFSRFAQAFARNLEGVVAIDGKAVRGAYERGRKTTPLHLVNVWAAEARLAIGQQLAPGRNEVRGALDALALLSLKGCIVTADALHCRQDTAKAILATGADYALALKNNQPRLRQQAEALLQAAPEPDRAQNLPLTAHDRTELRRAAIVPASGLGFPGLKAVARVETIRSAHNGATTSVARFFLLSTIVPASRMIDIARTHWSIENQLHWVLDVDLAEDAARTRKDNGPQNLAILRKIALNLLRTHP
ncbi:MAG: ISAs1 family transposase, partial [Pseudomonadota bacterium]